MVQRLLFRDTCTHYWGSVPSAKDISAPVGVVLGFPLLFRGGKNLSTAHASVMCRGSLSGKAS